MSNYTETTNFTALTTAHAVINGAAFDLEYGNIATAIASKFDNIAGYTGPFVMNAPATGNTLTVSGASGSYTLIVAGNSASGLSEGLYVNAGTTAADNAVVVQNQAQSQFYFRVFGDGGVTIGSPTGGDQGLGTLNLTNLFISGSPLYVGSPVNAQSTTYTLVLSDQNKTVYATGSTSTITIPANASVAFPVGTMVTFANRGSGNMSIPITSDTMVLSPGGATGTRTLAASGIATALKVSATVWMIAGSGLT
jgi:hypothetical protein